MCEGRLLMDDYEFLLLREMENYFGNDFKRINHARSVLDFTKKLMTTEEGDEKVIILPKFHTSG